MLREVHGYLAAEGSGKRTMKFRVGTVWIEGHVIASGPRRGTRQEVCHCAYRAGDPPTDLLLFVGGIFILQDLERYLEVPAHFALTKVSVSARRDDYLQ